MSRPERARSKNGAEGKRLLASDAPVTSKLHDSGVRKVLDRSAVEDDSSYLVMEYVAGERVARTESEQPLRRTVKMGGLARPERHSNRGLRTRRPEGKDLAGLEVILDRALSSLWM